MRRTLSSLLTIPSKIISLVSWVIALGIALTMFFGISQSANQSEKWIFLGVLIIFTVATWFEIRLKTIDVDAHNLYISNFTKEISLPLSEILNVTQNRWLRGELVTIHLKSPSEFGKKILFLPRSRFFPFGQHPVVRELKALAKKASTVEQTSLV